MTAKDTYDVIFAAVGLAGAVVVFAVGLYQYLEAQKWKRAEFVAQEAKDFFANAKVAVALTMIDWGRRKVNLDPTGDGYSRVVTRDMQSRALLPHPMVGALGSDEEVEADEEEDEFGFRTHEGLIRDCYDALLDGFERFGGHVRSRLVSAPELRPYLGYWIDDIASPATSKEDARWNACLLAYIAYYRYDGVVALFRECGYDIRFEGARATAFLDMLDDPQFVGTLRTTIRDNPAVTSH